MLPSYPARVSPRFAVSSGHTTAGGLNPCYVDNSSDTDKRVQVAVSRTDRLEAEPLSLSGSGDWGQLDAQFIAYRVAVSGGATLTMAPNESMVSLPPRE